MSELPRAGHEAALLCEVDEPADRPRIRAAPESPVWCVSDLGLHGAMQALREWRPDLIYAHSDLTEQIEGEVLALAPAAFFAHNYCGTCISGEKIHKWPVSSPCERRFGWQCLAHYYPHRCGGLSPITMLTEYTRQTRRRRLLHRYRMILTASEHMRSEYIRHGFSPSSVRKIPYPIESSRALFTGNSNTPDAADAKPSAPSRLLFVGRMTHLKGGPHFLDALPAVRVKLAKPLQVTFAGDGPERARWQARANQLEASSRGIAIEFTGWADRARLAALFAESDLLVVPSLWPEPFGLVGLEAGQHGLPAAAFAVGGVSEWLIDGVNGHLAPGDPPTAAGLAEAIAACLLAPAKHAALRRGALAMARRFSVANHMAALSSVFIDTLSQDSEALSI